MGDYQLVLVMAGNAREAEIWRRKEGLSPRQSVYASSPYTIEGMRPARVVMLAGFGNVPAMKAHQISAVVRHIIAKSRDPIEIEYP